MSRAPFGPDDETFRVSRTRGAAALSLLVVGGHVQMTCSLPAGGELRIGRADGNDVRIDDASISRQHARLLLGPPLAIEDLGSANGTVVGGRLVEPLSPVPFGLGEPIELGTVMLVVHRVATDPSGARAPLRAQSPPTSFALPALDCAGGPAVVADARMTRLYQLIERVADSDLPVLVLGETGVGKEVVAETLHRLSPRRAGPYLRINCGALAPTLVESELFGHERGAFTGASAARKGLLESASGGTVLLDELGELPPLVQVKLLRVLEEQKITRVGGVEPRPINVRFVGATHRDLRADVARGTFRRDLFFRLHGFSITIPPLRDRVHEIAPLARRFAAEALRAAGSADPVRVAEHVLGPAVVAHLERRTWAGNVRELAQAVRTAVVLSGGGPLDIEHFPVELEPLEEMHGADRAIVSTADAPSRLAARTVSYPLDVPDASPPRPAPGDLRQQLATSERQMILEALERCDGNQTRAAELLGMPRRTLVKRLAQYDVARPRKR